MDGLVNGIVDREATYKQQSSLLSQNLEFECIMPRLKSLDKNICSFKVVTFS